MPVPSPRNMPILCLDTCVVLDIMRDPTRDTIRLHEHEASLALLRAAETDKKLIVLVAEQVREEFEDNVDKVQEGAEKAMMKLRNQINKVNGLVTLHGASGSINLNHWKDHEVRCHEVANRWLQIGHLVPRTEQIISRAYFRSTKAIPPARSGKDSIQDCVILETYLARVHELRQGGLTAPIVFVSSNTRDYAELSEEEAEVRNDIKDEFESLELEYAPNMAAAKHFLKL